MDVPSLFEEVAGMCIAGDVTGPVALLKRPDCTPDLLAGGKPIGALHAAAIGGCPEAVRLLAAAGARLEDPQEAVSCRGLGRPPCFLGKPITDEQRRVLFHTRGAFEAAAELGHREVLVALAEVGAKPVGCRFLSIMFHNKTIEDPLPLLLQLLDMCRGMGMLGWESSLCACLRTSNFERHVQPRDTRRQLVRFLGQEAAAGRFMLPANEHSVQYVLPAAAELGQLAEQELLAAHVPPHLASPALARGILLGALRGELLGVVGQAAAAAAVPAEQPSSPLARLLAPHFDSLVAAMLPKLLSEAQSSQRAAFVDLLLDAGHPMTDAAVFACVEREDTAALAAALSRGMPPQPLCRHLEGSRLLMLPSKRGSWRYPCHILRALEIRHAWGWGPSHDSRLVAIMEVLLGAGYRPTVYANVQVSRDGGPTTLVPRFDPIEEDAGLDLDDCSKYLWLAIQRPEWSPAEHHRFPPAFQAAAQALLLAAHRWGSTAVGASHDAEAAGLPGSARLGALPSDVLLQVLAAAAYPLSQWITYNPPAESVVCKSTTRSYW